MDDFKQWLARALLSCASRLLQTKRAYNARQRWMFDNDWSQPVSKTDFAEKELPNND